MIRIEQVALEKIEPGTRLAVALSDATGKVLLAEGAELTQGLIASLQKRGVSHVPVAVETSCSPEELSAQREKIEGRVLWLFRNDSGDPLMGRLREAVLEYRLGEEQ